jgi:hypothetical protein
MTDPAERERRKYAAQNLRASGSKVQGLWTWLHRIEIWAVIALFAAGLIAAFFS